MFTAPTIDWAALSPVIIVLGAAIIGVLVEAFAPAKARRPAQLGLSIAALVGALVAVAALWPGVKKTGGTTVLGGSLLVDGPTLVLWATTAALALIALLIIADRTETGEDAFAPNAAAVPGSDYEDVARRKGVRQTEIFPLVLFATGGMLVFPAAGDLLDALRRSRGPVSAALPAHGHGPAPPPALAGGVDEVLPARCVLLRAVRVRHRAGLRVQRLAALLGHRDVDRDAERHGEPAARRRRADPGRSAVQGRCRAVPHVDPGRLPGRTDADHRLHGRLHQGRRVRCAAADRLHGVPGPELGPRRGALDGRDPDHGHRYGRRPGAERHEAHPRVLLGRARGVHPHGHHRDGPGRDHRGALLPAWCTAPRRSVRSASCGSCASGPARVPTARRARSSARRRTCPSGPGWAGPARCSL